jgi:hypothetical protein
MTPEMILAVGFIVSISLVLVALQGRNKLEELKRASDEASLRVDEALEKANEAMAKIGEAKRVASSIGIGLNSELNTHQMLLPILSSIAATVAALEDLDNDTKFQFALSKWSQISASPIPLSSIDQQDLKIYLRVIHSIMQSINEPDWTSRFRDRLKDLKADGLILLSTEGKQDIQKLIETLKPGATGEPAGDDYRQFVEILDSALLHSTL